MKILFLSVLALFIATPGFASEKRLIDAKTKALMNQLYESMAEVMPLTYEPEAFKDKSNKDKITSSLNNLAEFGKELDKISTASSEKGFRFMSKTFSSDVQQINRWYEEGDFEGARFYLHQVMDDCIQCHSKLPSDQSFTASSQLFKGVTFKSLPPLEKARLQVATRAFDQALQTYEDYFLSKEGIQESPYSKGSYLDYLKICIRVKEDLSRPAKLFKKILQRGVLPKYLQRLVETWVTDLEVVGSKGFLKKVTLDEAKALIDEGKRKMAFGTDRVSIIYYASASAILHKIVVQEETKVLIKAEAYYLLGIVESLLEHSFWVSESKHYYESSIRLAPKSPFAGKAYALLEEQVVLEYTGSKGMHIPTELKKWLEELKKLVK